MKTKEPVSNKQRAPVGTVKQQKTIRLHAPARDGVESPKLCHRHDAVPDLGDFFISLLGIEEAVCHAIGSIHCLTSLLNEEMPKFALESVQKSVEYSISFRATGAAIDLQLALDRTSEEVTRVHDLIRSRLLHSNAPDQRLVSEPCAADCRRRACR